MRACAHPPLTHTHHLYLHTAAHISVLLQHFITASAMIHNLQYCITAPMVTVHPTHIRSTKIVSTFPQWYVVNACIFKIGDAETQRMHTREIEPRSSTCTIPCPSTGCVNSQCYFCVGPSSKFHSRVFQRLYLHRIAALVTFRAHEFYWKVSLTYSHINT